MTQGRYRFQVAGYMHERVVTLVYVTCSL